MNEKGSATILTLLVSAVMITVGIGFNWLVNEHLKAAEGLKTKAEAMVQARSLYDALIYRMLTGQLTQQQILFPDHEFEGVTAIPLGKSVRLANGASIQIQDSSGRISLLTPDVGALKRLASIAGATADIAATIADSYADWIDGDDLTHVNGAEAFYYRTEGKTYKPRNFPIQYKDEFKLIRGMDAELYAKMEPYLTVLPTYGFNPNTASDAVLKAYADIDDSTLAQVKNYLTQKTISSDAEFVALTGRLLRRDAESIFYFPSPFFDITVTIGAPKSVYRLNVGVDMRPKLTSPCGVVYWTEG